LSRSAGLVLLLFGATTHAAMAWFSFQGTPVIESDGSTSPLLVALSIVQAAVLWLFLASLRFRGDE